MRKPVKFCTPWVSGVFLLIGLVLLTTGIILACVVFPNALHNGIVDFTKLEEGTEQWDRFVDIPFPLDFKVYLFNVTNPDDILKGEKPIVNEVGPYTYYQERHKRDIVVDAEQDRISYYQDQKFSFNKNMSGDLTEDDKLTILSLPMLGLIQISEQIGADFLDIESALEGMFGAKNFMYEVRVGDLLFDGVKICDPDTTSVTGKVLCLAITLLNIKNMKYAEDGSIKFSLFSYKSEAPDGYYTIHGGLGDINDLATIVEWEHMDYMPGYWGDEENDCNRVEGYDSTLYPPFNDDDSSFKILSTDIYRKVPIYYHSDMEYKDIPGKRYGVHEDAFWDIYPEESCFCTMKTKDMDGNYTCYLDGVVDVYTVFSVPTLLSLPHYLYAHGKYVDSVKGLNPNEEDHYTFVDLEPNTGTPLTGSKKIQISMVLRKVPYGDRYFDITKDLVGSALPVFWMDEGMTLPDEYVDLIQDKYLHIKRILTGVQWGVIAFSCVEIVVAGIFVFYSLKWTKTN